MTKKKATTTVKVPAKLAAATATSGKKPAGKAAAAPKKAEKSVAPPPAPSNSEDLDEDGEDAELMASGSMGAGASASASAGLNGPTSAQMAESSGGMKSFRHHPELENFYRFIYENDLRFEALAILDEILNEKRARKAVKVAKSKTH